LWVGLRGPASVIGESRETAGREVHFDRNWTKVYRGMAGIGPPFAG
jgi:hypothetical protein